MRAERVDVGAIGRTQGSLVSAWLDLPVKRPVVLVLVVLIVAAPAWLLADWLKNFALHPTDFIYIEEAIDARALRKHLFVPLNTHVVPLFRLYTYAVVQSTDRLEHLPRMLLGASYLGLVATMLLVGRLVRQETGRTGPALGAMACMGITTVVLPVVSHYAASQALWSGAAIVATLLATHAWRSRGGTWRLVPAAIGVFAAPAIWSGGLVAGPAAAAALWADGRPRCRRAAVAMIALSSVAALVILGLSRQYINEDAVVNEIHRELWPRPIQGFLNAIQAVAEATILNNLGLDAATSAFQAAVILGIVAGLWYASRGRTGRATPLEAAGAATVVCTRPACLLVPRQPALQQPAAGGLVLRDPSGRGRPVRSRLVVGSLRWGVQSRRQVDRSWGAGRRVAGPGPLWDSGRSRRKAAHRGRAPSGTLGIRHVLERVHAECKSHLLECRILGTSASNAGPA